MYQAVGLWISFMGKMPEERRAGRGWAMVLESSVSNPGVALRLEVQKRGMDGGYRKEWGGSGQGVGAAHLPWPPVPSASLSAQTLCCS